MTGTFVGLLRGINAGKLPRIAMPDCARSASPWAGATCEATSRAETLVSEAPGSPAALEERLEGMGESGEGDAPEVGL